MALTYPPDFYLQGFTPGGTKDAMRDLVWYMNGNGQSQANTITWKCIDCYDGTTREQPTGGDMSTLSGGQLWKPGAVTTLGTSNWCVLESPGDAFVAAKFHVIWRTQSFSRMYIGMFPNGDFVPGGAATGTPAVPAAALGHFPSASNGTLRFSNFSDRIWSVLFDEGMLLVRAVKVGALNWGYVGEVASINPESLMPRPFILSANVINGLEPDQPDFKYIDLDDGTSINAARNNGDALPAVDDDVEYNDLGVEYLVKVGFYSNTANSSIEFGFLRNVAACSKHIGSTGVGHTMGYAAGDYRFEEWETGSDTPHMVTIWPPGTALTDHTIIAEASVPDTLVPATGGGGDTVAPVVTYVRPLANSTIRSNTAITVEVTDTSGSFAGVQLRVQFNSAVPSRATETIHGGDLLGDFEPFYQDCTVQTITDGYRFVLIRVNPDPKGSDTGWPSAPTFVATPVDSSGNAI